jgi:hypothetical protein
MILMWGDIEALAPGVLLSTVATYCLLIGFIFKIAYTLFSFAIIRFLPAGLFPETPSTLDNGTISLFQAWEYAHKSKDYEVVRMFDERRASLSRHRAVMADLGRRPAPAAESGGVRGPATL